jgi:hypothetical protein
MCPPPSRHQKREKTNLERRDMHSQLQPSCIQLFPHNKPLVIIVVNPLATQKNSNVLIKKEGTWGGVMACGLVGTSTKETRGQNITTLGIIWSIL